MKYRPLNSLAKEIRLITLEPSEKYTSPIKASTECISLNELPFYTALSYCWGRSGNSEAITIDHNRLTVTGSLLQALQCLRAKNCLRFWVDQICINQSDNDEKANQIRMIRLIYHRAAAVVAWIGDDDPSGYISTLFQRVAQLKTNNDAESLGASAMMDQHISVLLEREYWMRVWIIQELAVGREVYIQCGQHGVGWVALSMVLKGSMARRQYYEGDLPPRLHSVRFLTHMSQLKQPPSLVEAICRTSESHSSVAKDKVYSLLGLVSDADLLVPTANYNHTYTAEDLCFEFTLATIISQNLRIVPLLGRGCDDSSVQSGRPSWVPRWHALDGRDLKRQIASMFGTDPSRHGESRIKAAGDSKPLITQAGGVLTCAALHIGDIHSQTRTVSEQQSGSVQVQTIHDRDSSPYAKAELDTIVAAFLDATGVIANHTQPFDEFTALRNDSSPTARYSLATGLENRPDCLAEFARIWRSNYHTGLSPEVQKWVDDHKQLVILGKTLQQWAKCMTLDLRFILSRMRQAMKRQSRRQCHSQKHLLPRLFYFVEHGMRLITTTTGYIGWAHERAKLNDSIFILRGSTVPVILRARQGGGFVLVGDAHVCGMMSGEGMKPDDDSAWTTVQIH
ncbi:heterokaryon incompatibility protein-domain-containing protein [Apiospora arundinis]|uniref:Heterokaryon incompatibility protein-domain-containing protein n=1 Tax=Apiospora arundinis TaxID=335852 RepID=A0ABR2HPP9_9PEZI